jgi:hypothetical protein
VGWWKTLVSLGRKPKNRYKVECNPRILE